MLNLVSLLIGCQMIELALKILCAFFVYQLSNSLRDVVFLLLHFDSLIYPLAHNILQSNKCAF